MKVRIEQLTEINFSDFEALTSCESGGGCYCSFWHQKISSMQEWDQRKKETPHLNRQIVLDKIKTGFHAGVLAYADGELLAWISMGPLTDFYWTWKRVGQLGESSNTVAGITCFTVAPKFRKQGLQSKILKELIEYGKAQGWSSIEAYPFDRSAVEKHKDLVLWPGHTKGYVDAGFLKVGSHWLHSADAERSIFKVDL
jgi:GNAT superfamily N-acetyltransferase